MTIRPSALPALPLIGRSRDLGVIEHFLHDVQSGARLALTLSGDPGVGKSRLAEKAMHSARERGFRVLRARSAPVEAALPYGLWTSALLPALRDSTEDTLSAWTGGRAADLEPIFPQLFAVERAHRSDVPGDLRARTYWAFAELIRGMASDRPLLIVLDDLHWADHASLALLQFLLHQKDATLVGFLLVYTPIQSRENPAFRDAEATIRRESRHHAVEALLPEDTTALLESTFGVGRSVLGEFATDFHRLAGGNPLFMEEVLRSLVAERRLREVDGVWLGWESSPDEVSGSVAEMVEQRLHRLSPSARACADILAVAGRHGTFGLLSELAEESDDRVAEAVEALRVQGVVDEIPSDRDVAFEFRHPIVREAMYGRMGAARVSTLHRRIAESIGHMWPTAAPDRIEAMAHHFALVRGGLPPEAVAVLAEAGVQALKRHATLEGTRYLGTALENAEPGSAAVWRLREGLAGARSRLGDYAAARTHWLEILEHEGPHAPPERTAELQRKLGQVSYWSGSLDQALEHADAGLAATQEGADPVLLSRLHLLRGIALQSLGRGDEAGAEMRIALEHAETVGDRTLLARVHRGLALLHTWKGDAEEMRSHANATIRLGTEADDAGITFWGHYALSVMEGLLGDTATMEAHLTACRRLAGSVGSPVLELWTDEVRLEHAASAGRWTDGIALGERAVAHARALGQEGLLPRLLVWLSLIYLGRDDLERGAAAVEEAWSHAEGTLQASANVHVVLPAHIGRCALHLARAEFREAADIGEAGLAVAENTGYVLWAVHRLLPFMAEAYLRLDDMAGARRIARRLEDYTSAIGHPLGQAWLDALLGLEARAAGDPDRGIALLRKAAEALEVIPMIPDALRIRRQIARVLGEVGRRDEAVTELRAVYSRLDQLGMAREMRTAESQFRELGSRPPTKASAAGAHGLTGREVEVARLVGAGKSNKAIARSLGLSPRTVSTHLANAYRKLGLTGGREELADFVHRRGLEG